MIVVGLDHHQPIPLDKPQRDRMPLLTGSPGEDDLGAVATDALDLDRGRVFGHDDRGRHAQQSRGTGHCLPVVAARVGEDPVGTLRIGQ
jgi:hypothetical protein